MQTSTELFVCAASAALLFSGCSTAPLSLSIHETSPGVFEGRKPKTEADFATLRQNKIRTILSLQTLTCAVEPERKRAEQNGLALLNVPILASPFGPRERNVKAALQILATPSLKPIYVHCLLGRDRTGVLLALYRVYYENWTPEAAWDDMIRRGGFKSRLGMLGFEMYFWRHTRRPAWVKGVVPAPKPKTPPNPGMGSAGSVAR